MCLKKIKIGEFLCSHFNIEDRTKYATLLVYYASYFNKGKNTKKGKNAKKKGVQYMERVTDPKC